MSAKVGGAVGLEDGNSVGESVGDVGGKVGRFDGTRLGRGLEPTSMGGKRARHQGRGSEGAIEEAPSASASEGHSAQATAAKSEPMMDSMLDHSSARASASSLMMLAPMTGAS